MPVQEYGCCHSLEDNSKETSLKVESVARYPCLQILEFAEIARPLYTSTKCGCTKPLNCTETKQKAFQTLKTVLSSTPALVQMSQNLRRTLTQLEMFYHTLSQLIRPCSYRMAHSSKCCRQMRTNEDVNSSQDLTPTGPHAIEALL